MSVTDDELDKLEQQIEAKAAEAPKAPEPAPEREPDPTPEPPPAAAASEPPGSEPAPFDSSEWVKKKGWRTPEDAAKSMRELEQAFHKQAEELRRTKEQQQPPFQPGWPAPQGAFPPPQNYPPQPQYAPPAAWAPPPNPYAPQTPWGPTPAQRPNEEQIALSYGLNVEDFRRMLPLVKDVAAVQAQQLAADMNAWRAKTERESDKANDLQNVMTDPAFHNPDVQFEMHDLFEKNKEMWNERRPYSTALEKALTSIARKSIGGGTRPSGSTLPTEPPKSGGHAGGGLPGKRGIGGMPSLAEMQSKSPEEIEKLLRSMNAVKNYGDY